MPTKPQNPRFFLEIEALPFSSDPANRLKQLLKIALRTFGLRCRGISPINEEAKSTSADDIATSVE